MNLLNSYLKCVFVLMCAVAAVAAAERRVICSTFPVYQVTRNVAAGRSGMNVALMLPSSMGCPHDYVLTPDDMRRLSSADILVINGAGLEEFIGAPIRRVNPDLILIDSSQGLPDLIEYPAKPHRHGHRHAHGHDHGRINPHFFASPRMSARQAQVIAAALAERDPDGADIYIRNARDYTARMNELVENLQEFGTALDNNRVIVAGDIFEYLLHDIGLAVAGTIESHGHAPSAAELLQIIRIVREADAAAIIIEQHSSSRLGATLAQETGLPVVALDPGDRGPADAAPDYFEKIMRRNLEKLRETLAAE